jgi:hypothetical protein
MPTTEPCAGWHIAIFAALAYFAVACSGASGTQTPDSTDACPGVSSQAIVGGDARESYLGLPSEQVRAIVSIVDGIEGPDAGGPLCSGVFVTSEWIATAGHCLQIQSPIVIVEGDGSAPRTTLPIVRGVAHPSEDVALLQIGAGEPGADASADVEADASATLALQGMTPIPAGDSSVGRLGTGDAVEMAGYGLTESRQVGSLRFLVESVASIDPSSISVSGFGVSGACDGDSGGPLLMRRADGAVEVAGVLSLGSAACRHDDTYVRLDAIRDWIDSVTGAYDAVDRACGGITDEGRCFYGDAVWCAGGELHAQGCSGGQSCGWNATSAGYRCIASGSDPCDGVDSVGRCADNVALECAAGVLHRQACGCAACRIDGISGVPACL